MHLGMKLSRKSTNKKGKHTFAESHDQVSVHDYENEKFYKCKRPALLTDIPVLRTGR